MTYTFEQIKRIASMYANSLNIKITISERPNADHFHYWAWAYTSWNQIMLGPGFWKLTGLGQIRALIHEILHCKYPPTRSTKGKKRQVGVHAGIWKEWALAFGKGIHWIEKYDILPEWRKHPYAKNPVMITATLNN